VSARLTLGLIAAVALLAFAGHAAADSPLPSWNDGPAKQAIVDFVAQVSEKGSSDFVPPAERIAVFDNDGTLWAEQPLYFQVAFALERIKTLAPEHPEWNDTQPFKAVIEGDLETALSGGEHALFELMMASHTGMTAVEFSAIAKEWARRGATNEINHTFTIAAQKCARDHSDPVNVQYQLRARSLARTTQTYLANHRRPAAR
jgi:hypothetical protein